MESSVESKRVLCLWLPNWPIQRLVVERKELRCSHLVLFQQDPRRGQLVAAASPLAARDGVRLQMPLSEAKSLLQRGTRRRAGSSFDRQAPSGAFHILAHEPERDLNALKRLADSVDAFSPIVGLEQSPQPDCLFLDVTGLAHLFQTAAGPGNEDSPAHQSSLAGEQELANRIQQHCQQLGYLVRIAIADTIGLAWAIARHGNQTKGSQSPVILPAGDRHCLAPLPVSSLRLADDTLETLSQLGIHGVEQLQRLPRADLTARLGTEVVQRLDQMMGHLAEPIVAYQRPPEFYAEQLLDYPTGDRETVEVILERLVDQLCQELRSRQQGALEWSFRVFCTGRQLPIRFFVRLFQPAAAVEHVMQLVRMQLENVLQSRPRQPRRSRHLRNLNGKPKRRRQVRSTDGEPLTVGEITVGVTSCVLLTQRQRQLFDENPRLDRQELAQLINRLASRLGHDQVVYPRLCRGAQPEYAAEWLPLINPLRRQPRSTGSSAAAHAQVMARPLQLLNQPIPIQAVSLAETQSDAPDHDPDEQPRDIPPDETPTVTASFSRFSHTSAPPALLIWPADTPAAIRPQSLAQAQSSGEREERYRVTGYWGPERIETGWWRAPTTRRDYWRIEIETDQQFWIFRDLRSNQWFLHGCF